MPPSTPPPPPPFALIPPYPQIGSLTSDSLPIMHSQLFLSVSRDLAHAPCDERVNLPLISPTLHLSLSPPGRYQPTFLLCINECPPTQEGSRGFVYSCQEESREFVYPCQFCQEGERGLRVWTSSPSSGNVPETLQLRATPHDAIFLPIVTSQGVFAGGPAGQDPPGCHGKVIGCDSVG